MQVHGGRFLVLIKQGVVNSAPTTPNSSVSRGKSIEYTHGNNIASYSYNTTGTGENEKINGTQGTVPCVPQIEHLIGGD